MCLAYVSSIVMRSIAAFLKLGPDSQSIPGPIIEGAIELCDTRLPIDIFTHERNIMINTTILMDRENLSLSGILKNCLILQGSLVYNSSWSLFCSAFGSSFLKFKKGIIICFFVLFLNICIFLFDTYDRFLVFIGLILTFCVDRVRETPSLTLLRSNEYLLPEAPQTKCTRIAILLM